MKMKQRSWRIMFASSNRLAASKAVLVTRGLGRADIIHLGTLYCRILQPFERLGCPKITSFHILDGSFL